MSKYDTVLNGLIRANPGMSKTDIAKKYQTKLRAAAKEDRDNAEAEESEQSGYSVLCDYILDPPKKPKSD
jgi:hypothetical protein